MHTPNVIEFDRERLSPALEDKLRKWLAQPEADTFRTVLRANCTFCQAEALKKSLQAQTGDTLDLLAQDEFRTARSFYICLNVFNRIADQEDPFVTPKLPPATQHANTNRTESEN